MPKTASGIEFSSYPNSISPKPPAEYLPLSSEPEHSFYKKLLHRKTSCFVAVIKTLRGRKCQIVHEVKMIIEL